MAVNMYKGDLDNTVQTPGSWLLMLRKANSRWRLIAPRYWLVWLGLGTMRLMSRLPFSWQILLGEGIGRLFGYLARYRRRIAAVNLRLCFPALSSRERGQLLNAHFAALGIGLFETALAWWGSDERVRRLAMVDGLAHLDQALACGKGVILLTAHVIPLELGARLVTLYRPFHALYRPHGNALFNTIMCYERERHSGLAMFARDDIRSMLRVLRQGHVVWYAPDQNYGPRHSVLVPFFGVPALTVTATSRLARLSGARVVPYCVQRLPGTAGYRVTLLPPLENFPGDDLAADALRINRLLEDWIRQMPEQYLWVHRRFKKGPPPFTHIYDSARSP
jgi:KDO2-lipid IV(A) lauroyltransferase